MPARRLGAPRALVTSIAALWPAAALAQEPAVPPLDDSQCRVVKVEMVPSDQLQIVVWIEDASGRYVDTAYISLLTGSYGLGNRPGMMSFNSAWRWPYGRRETTFPVWAHRHGMSWPLVVFQNEDDSNLSHPLAQSSIETFYCRPLRESDPGWDAQTCATTNPIYTDKGKLVPDGPRRSLYPPRADISYVEGTDDDSVRMFAELNPFDAVSRATPPGGQAFAVSWRIPDNLPDGDYVVWVEVSKEFDRNQAYSYPEPTGIPWSDFGAAYRGQPSVVYRAPFQIGGQTFSGRTDAYVGYGDPDDIDGVDGRLRAPDLTITSDRPGSGALRLLLAEDEAGAYRVKVTSRPSFDKQAPSAAASIRLLAADSRSATVAFTAPGDDGDIGEPAGYDIRVVAGTPMSDDNFEEARRISTAVTPMGAGEEQNFRLTDLLPSTNYYVGVRAYDECMNHGPMVSLRVTTGAPEGGEVSACFIATAAYGSAMAAEVGALRGFRDRFLRSHVAGELLVESYYTFGPALARVIRHSDALRRTARLALAPLVELARELSP
jgi:hypothetical protein